jgi:hypothetical protein
MGDDDPEGGHFKYVQKVRRMLPRKAGDPMIVPMKVLQVCNRIVNKIFTCVHTMKLVVSEVHGWGTLRGGGGVAGIGLATYIVS